MKFNLGCPNTPCQERNIALELFDFIIAANQNNHARLHEILVAREKFAIIFSVVTRTDPVRMQKHYDGLAIMMRLSPLTH